MSLRRQSCDRCHQERRKCDLVYPKCRRCQKAGKTCHFPYPPRPRQAQQHPQSGQPLTLSPHTRSNVETAVVSPMPALLPEASLPWVYNVLRQSPLIFASHGSNLFIHKSLFPQNATPRPLLTAFTLCAACTALTPMNRSLFFQALDVQVKDLIESMTANQPNSLLDDLARLQAAVLYQIIRLFYRADGFPTFQLEHPSQRQEDPYIPDIELETQEYSVRAFALRLLHRVNNIRSSSPSPDSGAQTQTWEEYLLAESIRRTVFVAFKIYTVYTALRYGWCVESAALELLPVSKKPARAWESREFYTDAEEQSVRSRVSNGDDTTTVVDFVRELSHGRGELEAYERVVLSAGSVCKWWGVVASRG
ncbi:hypothetical protein B0T16DRAFT_361869 [Cercophora newfieldiana]|uniref:Zn(2)-C6 fungal-type domain-containing protein n=1 Tax=Cercophora newfieldiana TaxID=92897 RepID=A0AA40CZF2_9PEZI|nr:hypothetical protein B0T16DRAFT_361869 [Cercophora newfieldiana]